MIKAIFFDIDGTLLSFKTHQVPESTQQAFQLLKEKNIKVLRHEGTGSHL
jgi:hydroxymethylpyrimidine pyrophosphatase-like HAD family hydrolase